MSNFTESDWLAFALGGVFGVGFGVLLAKVFIL